VIIYNTLSFPHRFYDELELVRVLICKPLNKVSFTEFSMLNYDGGGGGMGEVANDGGEVGGSVRGGGSRGNPYLIN